MSQAELRDEASIDEAVWLIEHMCQHLGLEDLATSDVLDFGCGVKFAQGRVRTDVNHGPAHGVSRSQRQ